MILVLSDLIVLFKLVKLLELLVILLVLLNLILFVIKLWGEIKLLFLINYYLKLVVCGFVELLFLLLW